MDVDNMLARYREKHWRMVAEVWYLQNKKRWWHTFVPCYQLRITYDGCYVTIFCLIVKWTSCLCERGTSVNCRQHFFQLFFFKGTLISIIEQCLISWNLSKASDSWWYEADGWHCLMIIDTYYDLVYHKSWFMQQRQSIIPRHFVKVSHQSTSSSPFPLLFGYCLWSQKYSHPRMHI